MANVFAVPTRRHHWGIIFKCFLCREDVRSELQASEDGSTQLRYFDVVENEKGVAESSFLGHISVEEMKLTIKKWDGGVFAPTEIATGKVIFLTACSSDEGYGVCCSEWGFNARLFMYMTHECCWALAINPVVQNENATAIREEDLLSLASRVHAIPALREGTPNRELCSPIPLHLIDLQSDTPLAHLIKNLASLTQELADEVLVGLQGSMVSSLFKTYRTLVEMLPCDFSLVKSNATSSLRFVSFGSIDNSRYLTSGTRVLFGETYLTEIAKGGEPGIGGQSIRIFDHEQINGLQIAVSAYGLRALRALYSDGTTSSWLGNPDRCWLGTIHGTSFTKWRVAFDHPRIVHVNHKAWLKYNPLHEHVKSLRGASLGLWDTDMRSELEGKFAHILRESVQRPGVFFYPSSRFLHYLSLVRGREHASGITVYASDGGLTGMKVHFSASCSHFGACTGLPLYFGLARGEFLTSAWYLAPSPIQPRSIPEESCLAVTTNYGRTYHFGEADSWDVAVEDDLGNIGTRHWRCLGSKSPTKITGFIFDAVNYRLRQTFGDIGVTDPSEAVGAAGTLNQNPQLLLGEYLPRRMANVGDQWDEDNDDDEEELANHQCHYHTSGSLEASVEASVAQGSVTFRWQ